MHVRDMRLLVYFAQVAQTGTVRGAARRLHVSAPVVSKAIGDLEERLGFALLVRGRRLTLTSEGEAVLEHALAMVRGAEQAMRSGSRVEPAGTVAMTLPTELCAAWLPPVLERFESRYPRVRLELSASDRPVALADSEFDVALRGRGARPDERSENAFATLPLALVCAPGQAGPRGLSLAERLRRLPFIGFSRRGTERRLQAMPRAGGPARELEIRPRVLVDNGLVACELAARGLGVALVSETIARDALARGRLVRLGRHLSFGTIALTLELRDRLPSPAARCLAEFVTGAGARART